MKPTSAEIEGLELQVVELQLALESAKDRLFAAKIAASGVSVGDIVVGKGRRKGHAGKLFIVREIDPSFSEPWIKASPQNANGEWSRSVVHLFNDWDHAS